MDSTTIIAVILLRLILYVDMDSFFAACEEIRHPELKGKPLVVGSNSEKDKMRGVVQACNYEARKFGIHSAMPTTMAYKLCPQLAYLQVDDKHYEETSSKIMAALSEYSPRMEVDSIDEAAMEIDVKDCQAAIELGKRIKERIRKDFSLACTAGISTGKMLAKMACDSAKPDGIRALEEKDIGDFLKDREVGKIPGVGKKTEERLAALKIKTIGQLAKTNPMVLIDSFGSFGKELYLIANGKDESVVEDNSNVVSIGRERTLDRNATGMDDVEEMLQKLANEVIVEVKRQKLMFKTIGVKVRYNDFTDRMKSKSLTNYSDSEELIISTARTLFAGLLGEKPVRKIGVRVSSFTSGSGQKKLF